jgi:type II secretory pathway component PulF
MPKVAVYQYTGVLVSENDRVESGAVVAESEEAAREKLRKYSVEKVKLQKIVGSSGFFMGFAANVK